MGLVFLSGGTQRLVTRRFLIEQVSSVRIIHLLRDAGPRFTTHGSVQQGEVPESMTM